MFDLIFIAFVSRLFLEIVGIFRFVDEVKHDYNSVFFFNPHELIKIVPPKVLQGFTICPRELNCDCCCFLSVTYNTGPDQSVSIFDFFSERSLFSENFLIRMFEGSPVSFLKFGNRMDDEKFLIFSAS